MVGDIPEYLDKTASPTSFILETKLLLNSIIFDSGRGTLFLPYGLKDFSLRHQWTDHNTCELIQDISWQKFENYTTLMISFRSMDMCMLKSIKVCMV